MNIVIAGGTGLIGRRLVERCIMDGHHVTILSRTSHASTGSVRHEGWNGRDPGPWTRVLDEADAIVNLSGASVAGGRWTRRRKQLIFESRIDATRAIVQALGQAPRRTRVLVNASGVGYYGSVAEGDVTENHPPGEDFLANVCRQWESEAQKAESAGVRVAMLRTGMVLDSSGGALSRLKLPFVFFLGGPVGSGRQWLPWIHYDDLVGGILHIIATPQLTGPINLTAPESVRMSEFGSTLGRVMRRPSWLPVPSLAVQLLLGEMSGIVLTGQKAIPQKLVAGGYRFQFGRLEEALRNVVRG